MQADDNTFSCLGIEHEEVAAAPRCDCVPDGRHTENHANPSSEQRPGCSHVPHTNTEPQLHGSPRMLRGMSLGGDPTSGDNASEHGSQQDIMNSQGSRSTEDYDGSQLQASDDAESLSDGGAWECRDDEEEGDTLQGLLRALGEESRLPPPNQPLYEQLRDDLAKRILQVKRERYTFPEDVDELLNPEHSNPEDLGAEDMLWRHTGDYPLTVNWPSSITCRAYAQHHMKRWRHAANVSKSQMEETLRYNAHCLQPRERNDPGNLNNRFPPSIYACQEILHVPNAKTYEFHVCSRGCVHWWAYMDGASQHLQTCQGCRRCQCPHCHSERYKLEGARCRIREHEHVEPAQKCWFFFDVFYHMFLDEYWVAEVQHSREQKLSAFHQTPENDRLDEALQKDGFDPKKVCAFPSLPRPHESVYLARCFSESSFSIR